MDNFIPHTIIIFVSLFVVIPIAVSLLKSYPKLQEYGIFAALFLLIASQSLGLNYMADHEYVRGTTQAYEITLFDFFAITYYVVMAGKPDYKVKIFPPGTVFFVMFLIMECLSCVNSPNITYSLYEIFRLVKMGFFFMVLYNILLCYNCYALFVNGLAAGIIMNMAVVLYQKYVEGYYAVVGLMRHKNNAGLYMNVLMPVYLYISLNFNFAQKWKKYFYIFVFLCCTMAVVVTISRGAWAVSALVICATIAVSLYRESTPQKILTIAATALVLVIGIIKSYDTIYERVTVGNESGTSGRESLIYNATDMADRNFFGVGINNYTEANTLENNYGHIFESLDPVDEDRNIGKVETVYLLTAAECGWMGLAALILWYFYYLLQAILCSIYFWKSNMFYLPASISIGLGGAYLHSSLEWSLRYSQTFYLLMVMFSIVAALVTMKNQKRA